MIKCIIYVNIIGKDDGGMIQKKIKKVFAAFIAAALVICMLPASGVQAAAQIAKEVLMCVVEPTLVYDNVYGFYGGISSVYSEGRGSGAINTQGQEIIPCGKYERIISLKGIKAVGVMDSQNHAYLIDGTGNVIRDYGVCANMTYSRLPDGEHGIRLIFADNSYKLCRYDGTVVEQGDANYDNTYQEIVDTGLYSDVYELDEGFYLCNDINDEKVWYIVKPDKTVFRTYENCSRKPYNIAKNILDIEYTEEVYDEEYEEYYDVEYEKIVRYKTDTVICDSKDKIYSWFDGKYFYYDEEEDGHFFAWSYDDGICYELDNDGNVVKTIGNYSYVDYIDNGYYIAYNYYNDIKEYSLINCDMKVEVKLGNFENAYDDYINDKLVIQAKYIGLDYYVYYNTDGTVYFDESAYKDTYDEMKVCYDGYVLGFKYKNPDNTDEGCSKAVLMKLDGTVLFDAGECMSISHYYDNEIVVWHNNDDISEFDINGNLIFTYEYSKYKRITGIDTDGYIAIQSNDGKWGIYRRVANPALNPQQPKPSVNQPQPIPVINQQPPVAGSNVSAPKAVKISKAVAGKKKVTITLPKIKKQVKGYVVQYSLKKNFKGAKKVTAKKSKIVIKKLKSGKTYYFRVKAYTLDGNKKVLSKKWSKPKKVKIK